MVLQLHYWNCVLVGFMPWGFVCRDKIAENCTACIFVVTSQRSTFWAFTGEKIWKSYNDREVIIIFIWTLLLHMLRKGNIRICEIIYTHKYLFYETPWFLYTFTRLQTSDFFMSCVFLSLPILLLEQRSFLTRRLFQSWPVQSNQ